LAWLLGGAVDGIGGDAVGVEHHCRIVKLTCLAVAKATEAGIVASLLAGGEEKWGEQEYRKPTTSFVLTLSKHLSSSLIKETAPLTSLWAND